MKEGQILKVIGEGIEVSQMGYLDIPLEHVPEFIMHDADKLCFEFSKDHSIIYFPVGFTKTQLNMYNKKTPRSERKFVRCVIKKNVARLYFNRSNRLVNYFSQKADIYLIKRTKKEEIAVKFSNMEQIIQNEVNTQISESKSLSLGRHLPPLYGEHIIERFNKFMIIKLYSLGKFHSQDFKEQADLLITFNPKFIRNVGRTPSSKRIRILEGPSLEFQFRFSTKPLIDFTQKKEITYIKAIFLSDGIILSKDKRLQLPKDFNPIASEFIEGYQKGYVKCRKEYEVKYHEPFPFSKKEIYTLNDLLLEVKLNANMHFSLQFIKRVYWYYIVLWKQLERFHNEELPKYEKKHREEVFEVLLRILSIYNMFTNFYPEHIFISEKYFFQIFRKTVIKSRSIHDYMGDVGKLLSFYVSRKEVSERLVSKFESQKNIDEILEHLKEIFEDGVISDKDKTFLKKILMRY